MSEQQQTIDFVWTNDRQQHSDILEFWLCFSSFFFLRVKNSSKEPQQVQAFIGLIDVMSHCVQLFWWFLFIKCFASHSFDIILRFVMRSKNVQGEFLRTWAYKQNANEREDVEKRCRKSWNICHYHLWHATTKKKSWNRWNLTSDVDVCCIQFTCSRILKRNRKIGRKQSAIITILCKNAGGHGVVFVINSNVAIWIFQSWCCNL